MIVWETVSHDESASAVSLSEVCSSDTEVLDVGRLPTWTDFGVCLTLFWAFFLHVLTVVPLLVRSWFVLSRDLLNTDFGKYFLFIYLINGSNSLTFLSSKLLTLRFITLLLTVSNNTKYQFHILFGNIWFLGIFGYGIENFGLEWKRVGNRSSWNEGKVGYNTFIITSVLLFLHFNLAIRQGIGEPRFALTRKDQFN